MNKTSITIGISAYNEEKNIGNLLQSIFAQKFTDIQLAEVLVYSDGSTDNTVATAASWSKRVTVHEGKKRKGKWYRLNQMMHQAKGDIIVFLDADVILGSPR